MATVKPFAALRPNPKLAARICELPYDVCSSDEARAIAADNPLSFFHVSKPEIDLPPSTDLYDPSVYAKGAENFRKLIAEGALRQDAQPCFYLYRQIMGRHSQIGLVAVASCEEYLQNVIKKHELTRVDKEEDRLRHIEALGAQTGPVFLLYRAVPKLDELFGQLSNNPAEIDFTADDGVRHTSWMISDATTLRSIEEPFARVPRLYIADGHHRSAAAARVYQKRQGAGGSAHFLAVLFPHHQLQVLPYNRVLKDLHGHTPERLLERLAGVCVIKEGGSPQPGNKHEVAFYLQGRWRTLRFRPHLAAASDPFERLDVSLLQKHVLAPIFGIDDPRTSQRIHFVGGIRGVSELEKLVNTGPYACAFSLYPTSVEDLMAIADAGGVMPPKSTWFEPKLRDAMFCHFV